MKGLDFSEHFFLAVATKKHDSEQKIFQFLSFFCELAVILFFFPAGKS